MPDWALGFTSFSKRDHMKVLLILTSLFLSSQAFSRGVVLKCWEVGQTQSTENLVFQTDGEYIHENVLKVDGQSLTVASTGDESCIDWDFPSVCGSKIADAKGLVYSLQLAKTEERADGTETLIGYLHNQKKRAVALYCSREAL